MSEEPPVEEFDDIGADIAKAMESSPEPVTDKPAEKPVREDGREENGQFKTKEEPKETTSTEKTKRVPPKAWAKEYHDKFSTLPDEVQDYISQRESDAEKRLTSVDDERRLGKDLKEVIMPYMATIQAEGGTPQGAVKDLLNTAYVLRTGSPQQKAQVIAQVIQQYGVDLRYAGQQAQSQQQSSFDPNKFKQELLTDLQTQQENARIQSEITAFASNPENAHFETVKPLMKALLDSGSAATLKDAYQQAIWAHPEVRSILQAGQTAGQEEKRKTEIQAKIKAGSSVAGSPGSNAPSTAPKNNNNSIEDDIRAAMAQLG